MKTFREIREELKPEPGVGSLDLHPDMWDKLIEIEDRVEKLEEATRLVVRCPECRSTNVKFLWVGPMGDRTPLPHEHYLVFDCKSCGERFTQSYQGGRNQ